MAGGAGKHEQVPDKVTVANAAVPEEQQAGRVGDAAGKKPDHCFQGNGQDERTDDDENDPAHPKIKNERQFFQPDAGPEFYDHADDSKHPNQQEHGPAPRTAERTERERRISPGDQQKNRGMIGDLECAFPPCLRPGVIQSRAKIKQPHCGDEDHCANEERLTRLARRGHAKERRCDDRRRQAESVADAVRDFFVAGLVPFRRREKFVNRFHALRERS